MYTKLIEFKNKKLRGILVTNKKSKKCVLMCGGFERSATTEKKFKKLADELIKKNISSFRYDYGGVGLSDGNFSEITVKKMSNIIKLAREQLKKEIGCKDISVVAHSLAGCAVAQGFKNNYFNKIILLAPALNQKELLRYWFVINNKTKKIIWKNYKKYLNESAFLTDCKRKDKMTKLNCIAPAYFLENKDIDYSVYLKNLDDVLLVHGNEDDKVPIESINVNFKNKIIVKGGDHDLERPDMFKQWIKEAVNFLIK